MMDRIVALHNYLAIAQQCSFEPGQFDCALFVGGWVDTVMGDTRYVETYKGRYKTLAQGRRLLNRQGYKCLTDFADRELDFFTGWVNAHPGDLARVETGNLGAFGIVGCGGVIHVVSPVSGLDAVSLDRAREFYRIW